MPDILMSMCAMDMDTDITGTFPIMHPNSYIGWPLSILCLSELFHNGSISCRFSLVDGSALLDTPLPSSLSMCLDLYAMCFYNTLVLRMVGSVIHSGSLSTYLRSILGSGDRR